ncbi:MAG: DUF4157 domain-containing protein [Methylococcaceae bacterium]|nr:DUF4157 domain-containing protein [Methylococcaceae bacterium]MDP2392047.1 DUF4157 domain-containing protein [Methylococcaceae bacterium]MDP3020951.1 DUF4157 domain-containing protein [Methylococcaceae bacterium]MDP3391164.1 DUF4157 domain-containing protein [Methylococcaceae bacterium]MDP3931707.1 DUF4157 domain-containing protein [Methylococcaceae bacterium]
MNKTTVAQQAQITSTLATAQGLLQRKCACGNYTLAGGECMECAKKKNGLQRKLTIGASNDPLELEADRVAEQVMAAPTNSSVSRAPLRLQRYARQTSVGEDTAPYSVDRVLAGSGRPLEPVLREDMEQRFGHNFSQVRVHSGGAAEQSARDVNARAYAAGNNVVFGEGSFSPATQEGRRLIAHELAHVVQQSGSVGKIIARAPDPKAPKSNFTPQQQARLEQARLNQNADGTRIVGVLYTPDGKEYEFISGGPGRFYAHIEGKAVAKMNEMGYQKGVLLVEKEPCQTCDRSTYPYNPLQPSKGGPEVPLASSKTGEPLARETPKINTGLHKGSELRVVDPVSTNMYRGLKTPPPGGAPAAGSVLPTEPDIKPSPPPARAAPQNAPKEPAASKPTASPKAPSASVSTPLKSVGPPGAPTANAPSLTGTVNNKPPAAKVGSPVPIAAKPPASSNSAVTTGGGERQRFTAPVGAFSRPGNFAEDANAKAQAKGNGAILVVQGVLAILTYFADKYQRERADAAWAEAYPRIQEEVTRTGRGVVVYVEYTQNTGSSVLIFEGIHWSSGGHDGGQPGSLRASGQTASFSRSYVGPTEAQASITDETALIFRRDEARTKQRELQGLAELMAKEGWLGRKLRERAGDNINPIRVYDAKAHIVSASQSIKDKRYSDAVASLDKADAAMDEMWAQIKTYVGEKKLKELSGEN